MSRKQPPSPARQATRILFVFREENGQKREKRDPRLTGDRPLRGGVNGEQAGGKRRTAKRMREGAANATTFEKRKSGLAYLSASEAHWEQMAGERAAAVVGARNAI